MRRLNLDTTVFDKKTTTTITTNSKSKETKKPIFLSIFQKERERDNKPNNNKQEKGGEKRENKIKIKNIKKTFRFSIIHSLSVMCSSFGKRTMKKNRKIKRNHFY